MNKIETTIPELINMLKTVEPTIKKETKPIMMITSSKAKNQKKKGKFLKPKGGIKKKTKVLVTKQPKGTYFHCGVVGHWKMNYKEYLDSLKKGKASDTGQSSGIFFVEINIVSVKIGC